MSDNNSLWNDIRDFQFDREGDEITYSRKLAFGNDWNFDFTRRAVNEYKKFLYLCAISEKPLSPSPVIDKAWHLHLTYTKSYWEDLCNGILKKHIHHEPSKGKSGETAYHGRLYMETLEFYKNVFGNPPPLDIWPSSMEEYRNSQKFSIRRFINRAKSDNYIKAKLITMLVLILIFSFSTYIFLYGGVNNSDILDDRVIVEQIQNEDADLLNFIENNPKKILLAIIILTFIVFYIFFKTYTGGGPRNGSGYSLGGYATSCAACGSS